MEGKTVIITGGNRGLGKETAKTLAKKGAKIILACRNLQAACEAKEEIIRESKNTNIFVKQLNISSLKSVRAFAEEINSSEERLDVLLHNAAIVPEKLQFTEDELELAMATNHLGPFLLTHLLIELLKKSAPSRILVTSSVTYHFSSLNSKNLNLKTVPFLKSVRSIYFDSKFANICFTKELARRLQGTGVTANCFHPGLVDTEIWTRAPSFFSWPLEIFNKMFFVTVEKGSETGVFLASSEDVEGVSGKYFVDYKQCRLWGSVNNEVKWKEMWDVSKKLVQLSISDSHI
ncbi:hypothetical protein Zmor_026575 [Zophobas morio]|uniref:Retinol dehydrogenase 14 n=1 Tax=Zophobas morio TaxID=2755281 RepID=A0AA38HVM7_9CUCU|nr:hypothetical protein Zmor_026575 [Zophobas morio]